MRKMFIAFATLAMFTACGSSDNATQSDESTTNTEAVDESSNPIDAQLDEYEKLVDEFIEVTKKVQGGDLKEASRLSELGSQVSEKAMAFAEKAKEMSMDQAKRFEAISNKMTELNK